MSNFFVWVHSVDGVGGQASVTRSAVSMLIRGGHKVQVVEYGVYGFWSFWCFFQGFIKLIFSRATIYSPVSRSFWGVFRDLPIYVLAVLGRPLVVHIHGSDFRLLFHHRFLGMFVSHVLRVRTTIIATNLKTRNDLVRLGCKRVHCIENFFPTKFIGLNSVKKISNTFFWNSNIIMTKGVFEFLEAFSIYSNATGAVLRLSGEILGCSLMNQKETEKRLSFFLSNPNITYLGPLTRLETIQELINSEVCVLTSYSESQPLALIDGMCTGCRILCSDLSELREMTSKYPMVVYTEVTPTDILESIYNLRNLELVTSDSACEKALERFSEKLFRDKFMALM